MSIIISREIGELDDLPEISADVQWGDRSFTIIAKKTKRGAYTATCSGIPGWRCQAPDIEGIQESFADYCYAHIGDPSA